MTVVEDIADVRDPVVVAQDTAGAAVGETVFASVISISVHDAY